MRETLFPLSPVSRTDECLIYHDESKGVFENVWAHVLLLVPESASVELLRQLWKVRGRHGCEDKKLHFAEISGEKICQQDGSIVIKDWLQYGVEALRGKGSCVFSPSLGCKLGVIFFHTSADLDLYGGGIKGEKMLRYFETVLRMLLKGCAHGLYDQDNRLRVRGIITDGEPWHRKLDEIRILDRLISETREYVEIDRNAYVEGVVSDHTSPDCTDRDKAQFLQLADLLLGSIIHSCFRDLEHGNKKEKMIRPVREMLEKRRRGAGFRYSGHYRSFSLSFAAIEMGQWKFEQVDTKEIIYEDNQLKLFDLNEGAK